MKKLFSIFLASSFLTLAAPAMAEQEMYSIGDDVYTTPIVDSSDVQTMAGVDAERRRHCPRGYDLVPKRRFDFKKFRWVTVGYTCRRERQDNNRGERDGHYGGGRHGGAERGGDHDSRH